MEEKPQAGEPAPRVGRYEVRQVVARGAPGDVYQAFDPATERIVAVKTIGLRRPAGVPRREPVLRRLHAQARLWATLDHPGL